MDLSVILLEHKPAGFDISSKFFKVLADNFINSDYNTIYIEKDVFKKFLKENPKYNVSYKKDVNHIKKLLDEKGEITLDFY